MDFAFPYVGYPESAGRIFASQAQEHPYLEDELYAAGNLPPDPGVAASSWTDIPLFTSIAMLPYIGRQALRWMVGDANSPEWEIINANPPAPRAYPSNYEGPVIDITPPRTFGGVPAPQNGGYVGYQQPVGVGYQQPLSIGYQPGIVRSYGSYEPPVGTPANIGPVQPIGVPVTPAQPVQTGAVRSLNDNWRAGANTRGLLRNSEKMMYEHPEGRLLADDTGNNAAYFQWLEADNDMSVFGDGRRFPEMRSPLYSPASPRATQSAPFPPYFQPFAPGGVSVPKWSLPKF